MSIARYYRGDPNAPKPTRGARLGANAIITCQGKLLLERRWDCDEWGLIGGGVKHSETTLQAMCREIREELGLRVPPERLRKLTVCGEHGRTGRIAAYEDGSVWRMVIVVYGLELEEMPVLHTSAESRALRFFTPAELNDLNIVITHSDIVKNWFLSAYR